MKKVELLAPAGNLEKLKFAINYGADAVYVGGLEFSLRAMADNFTPEEMREGIRFAHERGKRVYVAVNIFPHNDDLKRLPDYLREIGDMGADAIILSDPGVYSYVKEYLPDMEIHISTQSNNVNYMTAKFWYNLGAKRIVLARELSLKEISEIKGKIPDDMELEVFVHGAMCISYSGRCLLSNYMTGRDSNRGACAHPCRYKYYLVEEKRPGQYYPVFEDNNGTYILNSMDLCMIDHIPELIKSGISSLKIEGRMKSSYYVANIIKSYRRAIDDFYKYGKDYKFDQGLMDEISKVSHRKYSTGFYFDKPSSQVYESSSYIRTHDIVGIVIDYDEEKRTAKIEQRNKVFRGDEVEILTPVEDNFKIKVEDIYDEEGNPLDSTPHPQMIYYLKTDVKLKPYDMLVCPKED